MGTLAQAAGRMGRGSGKKEKNLNELKQELEIDVHRVSVDELCKRFTSNVADGLTDDQVKKGIAEYGLNQLTPPPTTPEWIKFCQCLFSGFAMLLWFGAILCFLAYGIQASAYEEPRMITFTLELSSVLLLLSLESSPITRRPSPPRSWRVSRTWFPNTRWCAGTARRSR